MQLSLFMVLIVSFLFSGIVLFFLPPKHESVAITVAVVLAPATFTLGYLLIAFDEFGLLTLMAFFSAFTAVIGSTGAAAVVAIIKRDRHTASEQKRD